MNNVVTTLAPSFFIRSTSFVQATRKPTISLMGSKFSTIRPGTYDGRNVVTNLVLSILNGSSSFLHTIRTTIKAWMSLNFVKIPSPILELASLKHLKD